MAFFRIGNTGIAFGSIVQAIDLSQGEGPTTGLTHSLSIQYVDGSGVLQTATATPGSGLSITVPQGSPIFLDASACRSVETNADTEGEAWTGLGHRFDSGEALGGTWSLSGIPRDVVTGAGIAGHVYTTSGSFTLSHWVRDSAARQGLLTVSVTVPSLAAGTDIAEGGSWPTWQSNTVYNLAAGTNHTAKGAINLSGLHNVVIRKTGSGADPVVGTVNWHTVNISSTAQSRTRGCRLIGIDAANVQDSAVGSLYCAIVNGRCRQYNTAPHSYYWSVEAVGQTQKDNICRTRGLAFWNCGEVNSNGTNYVFIGEMKNVIARNVDFNKTGGDSGQHVWRGWFDGMDLTGCRFRSAVSLMSYNKIQGADNGSTFDAWPDDDRMGVWNGVAYRPVSRKLVMRNNVYGASGSNNSVGTNIEVMPENNDVADDQAIELSSVENNVWFVTSYVGMAVSFDGRHHQYFNNKLNLGAGSEVPYATNSRTNRIPPGWEGPYINAARPVVVP